MNKKIHNPLVLPTNLPIPVDDGACQHLVGMALPSISLLATDGEKINPSKISGTVVIYCYPRTGKPGVAPPDGWDLIAGARGCTPQSCAFRDAYAEFFKRKIKVFGLSTQDTRYQKEAADRLHLPFLLLSDKDFMFTHALGLPTFSVENMILNKRLTLICMNGKIAHVIYPVFPPNENAKEIIEWLNQ